MTFTGARTTNTRKQNARSWTRSGKQWELPSHISLRSTRFFKLKFNFQMDNCRSRSRNIERVQRANIYRLLRTPWHLCVCVRVRRTPYVSVWVFRILLQLQIFVFFPTDTHTRQNRTILFQLIFCVCLFLALAWLLLPLLLRALAFL